MDITGYYIVAMAKKDGLHSEVLVLNNNSSHFIVVTRLDEDATDAMKIETFQYGTSMYGEKTAKMALREALYKMMEVVMYAYDDEGETRR